MSKLFLATACAALLAITAGVTTSQAAGKGKWADSPPGWAKGEKTGWNVGHQPPWLVQGKTHGLGKPAHASGLALNVSV